MLKFPKWWSKFALFAGLMSAIALFLSPVSAQSKFPDVQDHWAQPCIEELAKRHIINGYQDGSFHPEAPLTRTEFAVMINGAFPALPAVREPIKFVDIPSNYWAGDAIEYAYTTGFLSGYLERVFNPNQKIQRGEALVALVTGLKYSPSQASDQILNAAFDDVAAIPNSFRNAIAAATEKQLVVNYPDLRTLQPTQPASRAEVASFFCQALGLSGLIPNQYIVNSNPTSNPPKVQSQEIRGTWITNIDSDVLFSPQGITKAVKHLAQLNFNTIYPTVWNWGYTLYPSQVAQRVIGRSVRLVTPLDSSLDPDLGTKGRDMLKEIIRQGHQKGMSVIPWFEFGFMAPADSELVQRHPDWLTHRRNGSLIEKEGIYDRVWLNPLHPEVQQFMLDLIAEIVSNYDVDGIQFDDHFALPVEFGYDPATIAMYQQETKQLPPDNYQDSFWVRWRSDQMNAFMERVFQTIKAHKNNCIISLAPNPLHFSLPVSLQDWFTWERRGWIEELVLQVYRDDMKRFITELEREEVKLAKSHIPVAIGIFTGLKGRSIPVTHIQNQIQVVRDRGFSGVSFFFYESLSKWGTETPTQRDQAFQAMFSTPVIRPNIFNGWKP